MDLSQFRMLMKELLNKDPDIVPLEDPLIVLDIKSAVCMDNNGKDANHTMEISRRVHFLRNGEECNMHKIYWCEGGIKLTEIANNNVGDNDLNPRMKYIMVRLEN